MRMPDSRIPKQVFLGQLAAGKCLQCGPVLRYKDTLKVNLKQCGIDSSALGDDTLDHPVEDSRVEALEHKRAVRKGLNLAATAALGHVTVAFQNWTPRLSTNSPMTSDPLFLTAQSVPFVLCAG